MSFREMMINVIPGEECRVAIVEDGKLEDFHAERLDGPSNHVGSIYVGKVVNVEPAIQAAFVDFGLEHNGFLHVSDVHPQYFPGEDGETTERVGKKTPRRERPPIQDCFRRGDEVAVQVLKEGVGTKGPTVTSYLSIPGRFLVMMPQMDKVGVSRKVEDEETRRKMREILDQLDLPEGFGFILRTAGMERTKAELKRDLAYLMRLWKDMESRWRSGSGKPRLLYSESDLLVRALRDLLTSDIERIVVDNESSLNRAARFLKIVAPRTTTKLAHYTGKTPIFHAMGIEPQVQMIHQREVPLPSGGRLVIDEAEALVAIDVNSGRSREARDSETNAYQTNLEAVDEICRQLRLRDLGGVIVNDLIDMRLSKHRRDIETRIKDNLKKDRARWTIAPISEFGILEMTRQRMRSSHEGQHFGECPTCHGRGLVQRPDSVAGDAMRELAATLDGKDVARVEMVVHPRIAGELLSAKRRTLSRIEKISGKRVDVRVSEAIGVDRVTFYAYDERGADLDLGKIRVSGVSKDALVEYQITPDAAEDWTDQDHHSVAEEEISEEVQQGDEFEPHPIELEPLGLEQFKDNTPRVAGRDSGRDVGRQGARGREPAQRQASANGYGPQGEGGMEGGEGGEGADAGGRRKRRRRRGRRGRGGAPDGVHGQFEQGAPIAGQPISGEYAPEQGEYAPTEGAQDEGEYAPHEQLQDEHDPAYGHAEPGYAGEGVNGEYAEGPEGSAEYDAGAAHASGQARHDQHAQGDAGYAGDPNAQPGGRKRRRRRRGRGGRGGGGGAPGQSPDQFAGQFQGSGPNGEWTEQDGQFDAAPGAPESSEPAPAGENYDDEYAQAGDQGVLEAGLPTESGEQNEHGDGPKRRRRRGRRGGRGSAGPNGSGGSDGPGGPVEAQNRDDGRRARPDARPDSRADARPSARPAEIAPVQQRPVNTTGAGRPKPKGPTSLADMFRSQPEDSGRPANASVPEEPVKRGRTYGPAPRAAKNEPRTTAQPARASAPAPATKSEDGAKPPVKVRTLYSSARRRLSAGEVKKTKREE